MSSSRSQRSQKSSVMRQRFAFDLKSVQAPGARDPVRGSARSAFRNCRWPSGSLRFPPGAPHRDGRRRCRPPSRSPHPIPHTERTASRSTPGPPECAGSTPYMSVFQGQMEFGWAISRAFAVVPRTGVPACAACRGMPLMMWMPNFSRRPCTKSASGLNPFPPADGREPVDRGNKAGPGVHVQRHVLPVQGGVRAGFVPLDIDDDVVPAGLSEVSGHVQRRSP